MSMNELERYYLVLGLEPGASLEEVNQAYKDLAFIWHPDRVPKENDRLREKAQEKLKEINDARDRLRSMQQKGQNKKGKAQPSPPPAPPRESKNSSRSYSYSQSWSQSRYQRPQQPPDLSGADFRGADLKEKD